VLDDTGNNAGATNRTEGIIAQITPAVVDGNSHFYVRLDGDNTIYDFALPNMIDIVAYRVGDSISFTYVEMKPVCMVIEIRSVIPPSVLPEPPSTTPDPPGTTTDPPGSVPGVAST